MDARQLLRAGAVPLALQRRSSDEYAPLPYGRRDWRALGDVAEWSARASRRLGRPLPELARSRVGTAIALRALNRAWGGEFYAVPEEATRDPGAAAAALGGEQLVVDVQTHYVAAERTASPGAAAVLGFIQSVAPDRWQGLGGAAGLSVAEFLRGVYLESETAVAVLTSAPGEEDYNILTNAEIAGTRELADRLAGSGRLLHHAIVHPNLPGELEALERLRDRYRPAGWKVYTLYESDRRKPGAGPARAYADRAAGRRGWRLDDETSGLPFLERSRALGVRIVCAHKGLSQLAPGGSPEDVGAAAAAFPELDFLVYHSGYEVGAAGEEEGAYSDAVAHLGTNRLVHSLRAAGVPAGANVYAELGSTWYVLMRRPREAAHVLGKLLRAVGEDNLLWGTDSIWYGSPQPLIDAFRAFRIPDELCGRHGYPQLTARVVEKVLGLNAARVYGVDVAAARRAAREDDLAWVRQALAHCAERGTPRV